MRMMMMMMMMMYKNPASAILKYSHLDPVYNLE